MAIKLGTAFGVPIFIDYSWFIIFALIVYTVGYGLMPVSYPNLSGIEYLSIGILSAIVLFASIVVHELAHSIVARNSGVKISKITLFLFGGASEMEGEPNEPNTELKMAAAGPITSIAIGAGTGALWLFSMYLKTSALIQAPLYYAFFVNVIVAAFNLIPAFPMDGGRILRSVLWRHNGDFINSTKTASTIGRAFAYAMMFLGIILLITIDFFTGLWLLLIAWFISSGASGELSQIIVQRDLANTKARDLMSRYVDSVSPEMTLADLSLEFINRKHNGFPVMENGELVGCVAMDDLRKVKRDYWNDRKIRDVMIGKKELVTIKESDRAQNVLLLMNKNRIGRIFVLDDSTGKLSGIITRSDVIKTLQIEEAILGHVSNSALRHMISVDNGMLFELEVPLKSGEDWVTSYNTGEFTLVNEKVLQLTEGQTKQYTFQALQKGKFLVKFNQISPQTQITNKSMIRGQGQIISYTIIVN